MSRIFSDGFESGNTGLWDRHYSDTGKCTIVHKDNSWWNNKSFEKPRLGNYVLLFDQTDAGILRLSSFLPKPNEVYIKFKFQFNNNNIPGKYKFISFFGFPNIYNFLGALFIDTNNRNLLSYINARTGNTEYATPFSILENKWYTLELYLKLSTAGLGGAIIFQVNGIPYEWQNIDTRGEITNDTSLGGIIFNCNSNIPTWLIDNVVLDNTQFPQAGDIIGVEPNAASTPSNFSNYQDTSFLNAVSGTGNITAIDNTYIYDKEVGKQQTYTIVNIPEVAQIHDVQINYRSMKSGTPEAMYIRPYLKNEDTFAEAFSTEIQTTSFKTYYYHWQLDPFRSNIAWSRENVNSLNIGIKLSDG